MKGDLLMPSDIEIARSAKLKPITQIAGELGIEEEELELYGKYKAKLSDSLEKRLSGNKNGKLILVTAWRPGGGGKTTTTKSIGTSFCKIGKKAVVPASPVGSMGMRCRRRRIFRYCRWRTLIFTIGDIHAVSAATTFCHA